jgi:two-component system C4-dicarboxylate transport sensor histidine kinase DctB
VRGRADARVRVTLGAAGDDGAVRLVVDDDGPGVPPEIGERVFDPFFTTKPPGEGLGLGLAISRAIAADYGATLSVGTADETPDNGPCGGRFVLSLQAWRPA